MEKQPLVIERVLHAPAVQVWQALTDRNNMKEWYFDLASFKAEIGFEFSFYGGPDDHQYLHLCKITELVPGKKLTHSWRYEGYPGESFVSFEIFEEGENTRLVLTHSGLETFPGNNPDFARKNFEAGWTSIIGTNLPAYLERSLIQKT
jgi:uncharacterized protein YndB with AHSA1/START domain